MWTPFSSKCSHLNCKRKLRQLLTGMVFFATAGTIGCSSSVGTAPVATPVSTPLSISTQPANVTTPLAQTATFMVVASGGGTLSYQWNKNGDAISGATGSSYSTPPVLANDSKSIFTVAVSNSTGSVISNPAILTVGPRSPKPGDLRFQQVDAASTVNGFSATGFCDDVLAGYCTVGDGMTTPLILTESCDTPPLPVSLPIPPCVFFFSEFAPPADVKGLSSGALGDLLDNLQADFEGTGPSSHSIGPLNLPNTVVTSLTLSPINDFFGMTWIQSMQTPGFDMAQHTVSPSDFQSAANGEGQQSRVITAVSYNSGQVFYLSYGWTNDTSTIYETQVATATLETAATAATNLASEGYIITAMGGDGGLTNSILLVGTRVKGDTLPRPILVESLEDSYTPLAQQGYAIVGIVQVDDPNPNNLPVRNIIGER